MSFYRSEEPGTISSWALGNDGWIPAAKKKDQRETSLAGRPSSGTEPVAAAMIAAAGISQKVKILYVADSMSTHRRLELSGALYRELSRILPSYHIAIGLADGPFEDDEGTSSHFDEKVLDNKGRKSKFWRRKWIFAYRS